MSADGPPASAGTAKGPPDASASAARQDALRVAAFVLAVLGAFLAAIVVTECRSGLALAVSVAIGFVLAEIPAATFAVASTRLRLRAKAAVIALLCLAAPFVFALWVASAFCP